MPYKNKEDRARNYKKWRASNPGKGRAISKKWEQAHPEKTRAYGAKFRASVKGKKWRRDYEKQRRDSDDNFKIKARLRTRLYITLRKAGAKRAARTMTLVGCDIQFLRGYLEARFTEGMTWKNHGKWHIEHHIPLAEFDLREEAQQRQAFHYSNLRPMWGAQNQSKGSKRPPTHQAELL